VKGSGWKPDHVRVLFATTANDGHFGPLLPFARACVSTGHEVRVAAPISFGEVLARAGLRHETFADAPPEVIGPVMASLPTMTLDEADDVVLREVFGRIDAQAALPSLLETVERWRPHVIVRESAEIASVAAAERSGVPHVHVCIGMHEVASRFAEAIADPLEELGQLAGLDEGRLSAALAAETVFSLAPGLLDYASSRTPPEAHAFKRFHEPATAASGDRPPDWGDPDHPLVYVTFGSVAGSIPPFAGVFREALDALADLDARVLMTVGRQVDPDGLGPLPANAQVRRWLPQDEVLAHAAAMLGHGGFGTTMGALTAGVPQVVAPLFSFDQVVNGDHVASVGAGLCAGIGPGAVGRAAAEIPRLIANPTYADSARRVAAAIAQLPPPTEAVPILTGLIG
jgi:UDP:flavonoid glycosyltransferase YjiC (YdhE family)